MELLTTLWWLVPAAFGAGVLTATAGVGGGVLLLGLMGLVLPATAVVPVHAVLMTWQNATRLLMMLKWVDWHFVGVVALGSLVGAAFAGPVVLLFNEQLMQVLLGIGLLFLVWAPKPKREVLTWLPAKAKTLVIAVVTSVVSMWIGAAGVLFSVIRRRGGRDKEPVLADQSAIMVLQHGLKILVFGVFGFAFGPYLPLLVAMGLAGLLGTTLGIYGLRRMSNQWFDCIFKLVVTILAGVLLGRAFGL